MSVFPYNDLSVFCQGIRNDGCGAYLKVPFSCLFKFDCTHVGFECPLCEKITAVNCSDEGVSHDAALLSSKITVLSKGMLSCVSIRCDGRGYTQEGCGIGFVAYKKDGFYATSTLAPVSLVIECPFCGQWNVLNEESFLPDLNALKI